MARLRSGGECCFFSALLGIVILLSLLFMLGIPKIAIGIEYWASCPLAPVLPIYLCLTGVLGVACVGHSVFLWMCLFGKYMKRKKTHDFCLILWALLLLAVPIFQVLGGVYVIHVYQAKENNCDVINNMNNSSTLANHSQSPPRSRENDLVNVTMATLLFNSSNIHELPKYEVTHADTGSTESGGDNSSCLPCNNVVLMCAYITSLFELSVMTLPTIVFVAGAVLFRVRNKEVSQKSHNRLSHDL